MFTHCRALSRFLRIREADSKSGKYAFESIRDLAFLSRLHMIHRAIHQRILSRRLIKADFI